jgi:hypothetical protein
MTQKDMDLLNTLSETPGCQSEKIRDVSPKMVEVLKDKLARVEMQAHDLEAAIKALEKNPELTETLELIRRVNRF